MSDAATDARKNASALPFMVVWAMIVALVLTVPLTINVAMNGADAVIDVTPRDAEQRETISAIGPCLGGWAVVGLLAWALRWAIGYKRKVLAALDGEPLVEE